MNKRPKDLAGMSSLELEWIYRNYLNDREEILKIINEYFNVLVKLIGAMNGVKVPDMISDVDEGGEGLPDFDLYESLKEEYSYEEIKEILSEEDWELYNKWLRGEFDYG